jgi:hypothetical protein
MPDRLKFVRTRQGESLICSSDTAKQATLVHDDSSDTESEVGDDMLMACVQDPEEEERMVRGTAIYLSQQRSFEHVLESGPGSDGC